MREDDRGGIVPDRRLKDFSDPHRHGIDRAPIDHHKCERLIFGVEDDDVELFYSSWASATMSMPATSWGSRMRSRWSGHNRAPRAVSAVVPHPACHPVVRGARRAGDHRGQRRARGAWEGRGRVPAPRGAGGWDPAWVWWAWESFLCPGRSLLPGPSREQGRSDRAR